MKHKHYDMIVAKAANMEFVVFVKHEETESGGLLSSAVTHTEWSEAGYPGDQMPCFHSELDYFLCLPQHKEACLHWLNGGEALILDFPDDEIERVLESGAYSGWHYASVFMSESVKTRIKPKKEKRWIAVNMSRGVYCELFESKVEATEAYPHADQFIEIEIEV